MRNGLKNITGCDNVTMKDATMKYTEEGGVPVVNATPTSAGERMGAGGAIILGILVLVLVFGVIAPKIFGSEPGSEYQQMAKIEAAK